MSLDLNGNIESPSKHTKILVLKRQEAVSVVALLTAQLAGTTLSGYSGGACPSFRADGKLYFLVVNSSNEATSKEKVLSEFESVFILRDCDATGLVLDLVRILSKVSLLPHETFLHDQKVIFDVET